MRWRVVASAGILAAILVGGLLCRGAVERHCQRMETLLLRAEAGEERALGQAVSLWETRLGFLSVLVHHEKLEAVGESLARAEGAFAAADPAAAAYCHAARYLLSDIREYDHINLKNLW